MWSKFGVLALLLVLMFVPAIFAAHFGYTVNGVPEGGLSTNSGGMVLDAIGYLTHSLTFSIDGMPPAMGFFFIFVIIMMIAVIISMFGNVSIVGGIIFGLLSIGGLVSMLVGMIHC